MGDGPWTVERAVANDAKAIVRFQLAMARETEKLKLRPEVVLQGVQGILEDPSRGFYLMARDRMQRAVGCLLVLKEWSDWRNADVWWIHSVYVSHEDRRQGVFTAMFQHLEREARRLRVIGLRLYVERKNEGAKQVYVGLGMNNERYELFEKIF